MKAFCSVIQSPYDPGRSHEPATAAILSGTVRSLPLLPGSVHDLLALNVKDPALPEQLQAVVERDSALAAHVLRVANSAAYKGQAEVNTLGEAIHRIGAPMIVGNALQSSIHRIFDPYGGMGRRLGQIAVLEANIMSALAILWESKLQVAPEVAYVHGLLHDIGHLVMAIKLGKALESLGHRRIPADEVAQREAAVFGFDHQSAGRLLSNHWKLPESLTVVIATHHHVRELRTGHDPSVNAIIDLLQITDRLSRIMAQNAENPMKGEAAIAEWLVMPEAQKLLHPMGGSADEVLQAVPAAFLGVERDGKMSLGDKPVP